MLNSKTIYRPCTFLRTFQLKFSKSWIFVNQIQHSKHLCQISRHDIISLCKTFWVQFLLVSFSLTYDWIATLEERNKENKKRKTHERSWLQNKQGLNVDTPTSNAVIRCGDTGRGIKLLQFSIKLITRSELTATGNDKSGIAGALSAVSAESLTAPATVRPAHPGTWGTAAPRGARITAHRWGPRAVTWVQRGPAHGPWDKTTFISNEPQWRPLDFTSSTTS